MKKRNIFICINCNTDTVFFNGVCMLCSRKIPHYIPANQHRRYYKKKNNIKSRLI